MDFKVLQNLQSVGRRRQVMGPHVARQFDFPAVEGHFFPRMPAYKYFSHYFPILKNLNFESRVVEMLGNHCSNSPCSLQS